MRFVFSRIKANDLSVLFHFLVSEVEYYLERLSLSRHSFNDIFQSVTENEVKVPIYPHFRAAKISRKHL